MMTIAPVTMPADPIPAMARPTINVTELGATAQINEPISKMPISHRKTHLGEKKVYTRPNNSVKADDVSKKLDAYQPTSPNDLKSSVIRGTAVAMIVRSCTSVSRYQNKRISVTHQGHEKDCKIDADEDEEEFHAMGINSVVH